MEMAAPVGIDEPVPGVAGRQEASHSTFFKQDGMPAASQFLAVELGGSHADMAAEFIDHASANLTTMRVIWKSTRSPRLPKRSGEYRPQRSVRLTQAEPHGIVRDQYLRRRDMAMTELFTKSIRIGA